MRRVDLAVGAVDAVVGLVVHATIAGRVALGEVVQSIARRTGPPLAAEVVGFQRRAGDPAPARGALTGLAPASRGVAHGRAALQIRCGDDLLGRVLDGIGQPIDVPALR